MSITDNDSNGTTTTDSVENWIKQQIANFANIPAETVSGDAGFQSFGIDSARAISIMMDLEKWLNLPDELPLELLFEAKSVREASELIAVEANRMINDVQGGG